MSCFTDTYRIYHKTHLEYYFELLNILHSFATKLTKKISYE